jgi:5'(3')-deoxyribonucleotidase
MKKIAIDLDEILSDTLTSVLDYYNTIHKTSIKREDFHSYNYWEIWGGSRERAVKLIADYYKTDYFKNIKPVAGSIDGINKLKELGYEMYVVTGRSVEYKKQAINWLDKYFKNMFKDIFFADTFSVDIETKKKSEICKENGLKLIVEDDPYHIEDCTKAGIEVIYIEYPWNKNKEFKNAIKVSSWKEIPETIQKFTN